MSPSVSVSPSDPKLIVSDPVGAANDVVSNVAPESTSWPPLAVSVASFEERDWRLKTTVLDVPVFVIGSSPA